MEDVTEHTAELPAAEGELVEQRVGGLYGLPVVGRPARTVRDFYDGMKPAETDSFGVRAGKKLVRGGTVVVATGAAMMVVL